MNYLKYVPTDQLEGLARFFYDHPESTAVRVFTVDGSITYSKSEIMAELVKRG